MEKNMKKKLTKISAVLASCLLLLPALVSCADDDVVNNQVITNEETQNPVINSALKYVSINYTASYAYETVTVPYLVDAGGGNCVTVEYKSSDESVVNTASASFGWIYVTKDITAKTVTVTATASFGGASVSKEITVEVPACTEFEEDYYSSDTMTGYTKTSFDMENKTVISERKHSDSSISAKKYSFEFGENPGQLIVSFVAVKGESYCEDKNKWYTKDELLYSVPSVTQMLAAEADGTVFEYSIMKTDYSAENARKTYPKGAAIHAAAVYDSTKD